MLYFPIIFNFKFLNIFISIDILALHSSVRNYITLKLIFIFVIVSPVNKFSKTKFEYSSFALKISKLHKKTIIINHDFGIYRGCMEHYAIRIYGRNVSIHFDRIQTVA